MVCVILFFRIGDIMKIKKEELFNMMINNKIMLTGLFVLIFLFILALNFNRGSYSVENGNTSASLRVDCDEKVGIGEMVECLITLNNDSFNVNGISVKYDVMGELEFVSFSASDGWTNYVVNEDEIESEGFVLTGNGVDSDSVGVLKFKVSDRAFSNDIYKINLYDIELGDGEDTTIKLDDVEKNVKVDYLINNDDQKYIYTGTDVDDEVILNNTKIDDENGDVSIVDGKLIIKSKDTNEVISEFKIMNVKFDNYVVNDKVIFINTNMTVNEFVDNVVLTDGLSYKIVDNNSKVLDEDDKLEDGFNFQVYYGTEQLDNFKIRIDLEYNISFDNSLDIDRRNKFIKSLNLKTTVADFLDKVFVAGGDAYVYGGDNKRKSNGDIIGTGDRLIFYKDDIKIDEYTLSVLYDVTGDGKAGSLDIVLLRKHIVKSVNSQTGITEVQSGVYKLALDCNMDGNFGSLDIVLMRKKIAEG